MESHCSLIKSFARRSVGHETTGKTPGYERLERAGVSAIATLPVSPRLSLFLLAPPIRFVALFVLKQATGSDDRRRRHPYYLRPSRNDGNRVMIEPRGRTDPAWQIEKSSRYRPRVTSAF